MQQKNILWLLVFCLSAATNQLLAQQRAALYVEVISPPPPPPNSPERTASPPAAPTGVKLFHWLLVDGDSAVYHLAQDTSMLGIGDYEAGEAGFYTDLGTRRTIRVVKNPIMDLAVGYPLAETKEWTIKKEYIEVEGFKAYLATRDVPAGQVKAYFLPQVPMPFGPEIHSGLPGLVVRVEEPDGRVVELASFIGRVDSNLNFKFIEAEEMDVLTEVEYAKAKKEAVKGFVKRQRQKSGK